MSHETERSKRRRTKERSSDLMTVERNFSAGVKVRDATCNDVDCALDKGSPSVRHPPFPVITEWIFMTIFQPKGEKYLVEWVPFLNWHNVMGQQQPWWRQKADGMKVINKSLVKK